MNRPISFVHLPLHHKIIELQCAGLLLKEIAVILDRSLPVIHSTISVWLRGNGASLRFSAWLPIDFLPVFSRSHDTGRPVSEFIN